MCRFIAYIGNSIILDDILYKPKNSIIQQSIHVRDTDEPLNGDGFGLGWYAHDIDNNPGVFKSLQPAWNDQNLQYLAKKIRSDCFFVHVRAASAGGVSYANTHPFNYKHLLFMHNGDIGGFNKIKRYLRRELSDEIYDWIQGQTDSEHFFAMFLELLQKKQLNFNATHAADILSDTIQAIFKLQREHGIDEVSYINAAVTNGKSMVAIRYVSDPKIKPASLYYAAGKNYQFKEGNCELQSNGEQGYTTFIIASEKLNNHKATWHEIPANSMLLIDSDLGMQLREL